MKNQKKKNNHVTNLNCKIKETLGKLKLHCPEQVIFLNPTFSVSQSGFGFLHHPVYN
jgi:hypothetical protein